MSGYFLRIKVEDGENGRGFGGNKLKRNISMGEVFKKRIFFQGIESVVSRERARGCRKYPTPWMDNPPTPHPGTSYARLLTVYNTFASCGADSGFSCVCERHHLSLQLLVSVCGHVD